MLHDFHLHTFVSDGRLSPLEVLRQAARFGISSVAITDHDALGAYSWEKGAVFVETERLGLELTVGLEMDARLDGQEVHVLGLGVALQGGALHEHLDRVRAARFERARREIGIVNDLLGEGTVSENQVFVPGRETLMKPHFIHPILAKGLFSSYREANAWYKENVKAGVAVPKPCLNEAIELIHDAGGWAVLAHPGYYEKAGLPMAARLKELSEIGLDGIELDYPYHTSSPQQFSQADEKAFIDQMRATGEALGLRFTSGSDAHSVGDFRRVYGTRRAS